MAPIVALTTARAVVASNATAMQCPTAMRISNPLSRRGSPVLARLRPRSKKIHALVLSTSSESSDTSYPSVEDESSINGMTAFLDSLKYDANGLCVAIAQDIDTGEVLMQAFADRNAICETLQTGLGTFYSRSRRGRWCKGETSGHYLTVKSVYMDCDKDSIIYLCEPIGPACHTNAPTCYFQQINLVEGEDGSLSVRIAGEHTSTANAPMTTLYGLQRTIAARKAEMTGSGSGSTEKPSWTAKLLSNPELCCKKVREEAGELCQAHEEKEGKERAASEAADLLYHAMVLMNIEGITLEDVNRELRRREGTSGIVEKASRPKK